MGFSAKEISEYFTIYSNLVRHHDHYGIRLKRSELFIESLYSLEPKYQYYSLNDLTFFEYPVGSKNSSELKMATIWKAGY